MLRFIFLADTQLGCYATFSGFTEEQIEQYATMGMRVRPTPRVEGFEWDSRQYRKAIEIANHLRPDFVVVGGDMVDDANAEDQLDELMAVTARLDRSIPMYWVPGNHDIAPDALVPDSASIASYRDAFGPDYYVFEVAGTRFLVVNTVVIDHPERVWSDWESQREFIVETLSDAGPRTILLGHHPLFVERVDEPDSYWNLPFERRVYLLDLLKAGGVRIGFAGHWHRNTVAFAGEFEMVVSGPVGVPLGDDPSGYRLVEVDEEGVHHRYYPLDPD